MICSLDGPHQSCLQLHDALTRFFAAHPAAEAVRLQDPVLVHYLHTLRQVAHDHTVVFDEQAMHRRLVEAVRGLEEAKVRLRELREQPVDTSQLLDGLAT